MPDLISISGIFCALSALLLSLFAYFKDFNSRLHRIFAIHGLALALAFSALAFWPHEHSPVLAAFCFKWFCAASFMAEAIFFHYLAAWLKIGKYEKKAIASAYALALAVGLLAIGPYFIKDMQIASGVFVFRFGWFFYAYAFVLLIVFSSGCFLLKFFYNKKFASSRAKLKYLLLSLFLSFLGLAGIFFLFVGKTNAPFGVFVFVAGFVVFAYAALVKRAVEPSLIGKNLAFFFSAFVSIALLTVLAKYFAAKYLPHLRLWADLPILLFALFLFPLFKGLYIRAGNRFVFSSYYDSQKAIALLHERLHAVLSETKAYEAIGRVMQEVFGIKSFCAFSLCEKSREFALAHNKGFKINQGKTFAHSQVFDNVYFGSSRVLVVEEIITEKNQDCSFIAFLVRIDAELLIPIKIKRNIQGFIVLGAKRSGNAFNSKDIETLEIIGSQSSLAVENALMQKKTQDFNMLLEQEVERATKELRRANEKLKKLDSAKSEFISIASHQLRTPLTIIKGYISMVMEGNFGPVPAKIAEALKKVYDSNERLILLVENLLNISRIESGNLQFDFKETDLEELAISAIDELADTARKRNNHLVYKPAAQKLPSVIVDAGKIRHVILNLLDNAIKYSEKSEIIVKLSAEKDRIVFSVTDEGIGMDNEDIAGLFKKFYRGNVSPLIYTEGTGLGLYVAKQMVEAHKGRIWAKSGGHNKGTSFYFSLPLTI